MSCRSIGLRFRTDRIDLAARQILRGIQRHAAEARWLCTLDHTAGDAEPVRYDGIIAPANQPLGFRLRRLGVPSVHVGMQGGKCNPAPRVADHRHAAGRLAARHLLDHEYHRFLYLGYGRHGPTAWQEREYRRSVNVRGHGVDSVLLYRGGLDRLTARPRIRELLADWFGGLEPPFALLAVNPAFARLAAEVALAQGLRIPDDMGIVSAGDDPLYCEGHDCPVTAIDFRYEALGLRAARLLDHLIDGGPPPIRTVYVQPRLVPRRSTDRRFLDDAAVADALAFIARECHRPLRADEVAGAVGLGRRQLLRRVRRARKRTVRQEIVLARLGRARDMLGEDSWPVDVVARACGFANAGSFAKAWRRYHGEPPTAARAQRPDPPQVPDPLETAKRLLATTDRTIPDVAWVAGYRSDYCLRNALGLREHMSPREWRKLNRQPPPPLPPCKFTITFIGPDGEIEEQRTTDIPASPPPAAARPAEPFPADPGPVTLSFVGPTGEIVEQRGPDDTIDE